MMKTWTLSHHSIYLQLLVFSLAFSALTLLVGRQEGHLARKKYAGMVKVGTG